MENNSKDDSELSKWLLPASKQMEIWYYMGPDIKNKYIEKLLFPSCSNCNNKNSCDLEDENARLKCLLRRAYLFHKYGAKYFDINTKDRYFNLSKWTFWNKHKRR